MYNDDRQFPGGIYSFLLPGQQQQFGPSGQQFGPPPFGPPPGQGGPPFGPPPGQGGPPPFGPPGQGQQGGPGGPPPGPPPSTPPAQMQAGPAAASVQGAGGAQVFAVDPGSLYGCLFRYTYIRLITGQRFWFWPVFIGRTSVAGWRWRPREYRWVYTGFDTRLILSFSC
ncbi:hypothetical protein [Alteribacter keqinensis]|uniref:hypothetical protein n=1 Tax=Alteribacter keqinensis TaxID=2483800 RepID=UPI001C831C09|nr:hypothetical protein [Alteribacter keqinensis]